LATGNSLISTTLSKKCTASLITLPNSLQSIS